MSADRFSDEDLTAFLDGQADPVLSAEIGAELETDAHLQARLASLDIPIAALREGYDALLGQAPEPPRFDVVEEKAPKPRLWGLLGATFAGTFAGGLAAGILAAILITPSSPEAPSPGWKAAVANYQSLYASATLEGVRPDADTMRAELARVSAALGVGLDDLPQARGLEYRRAQILDWKGKALAQIVYQRADGTPVAFCILPIDDTSPLPMNPMNTDGATAVSWHSGGYGYLMIGGSELETLEREALPFERWSQAAT